MTSQRVDDRKVLVFLPTLNEVGRLEDLIRSLRRLAPGSPLLVVDDASSDGTAALLDRLSREDSNLTVIARPNRLGVGSAHKLAILYALDHGFEALITMNADRSHPPEALPKVLTALRTSELVVVCAAGRGGSLRSIASSSYRGMARSLLERLDVAAIGADDRSFAFESAMHLNRLVGRPTLLTEPGVARSEPPSLFAQARAIGRRFAQNIRRRPDRPRLDGAAEPLDCRACSGTYHVEVYPARDGSGVSAHPDASPYSCASHSGRSHGQILKCLTCGLIFMRPKISDAELVTEYSNVVDPVYLDNLPAREVTFQGTLKKVRRYIGDSARMLEIGSYCGAFLKVARQEGLDIVGLEPSQWAAGYSRSMSDAPVVRGTLDDLPAEHGRFDVVVAWDVLEHFADPVEELKKVNRILEDGGRFIFCTLMIDNWFPRLAGRYWPWLMDMHLFYFTEQSIRNVLAQAGFALIESTPYRHITTVEYLLRKLGTLGVPGASQVSRAASMTPWGKMQIPVRLGDIQLFVCSKVAPTDQPRVAPGRAKSARRTNGKSTRIGT